MVSKKTNNYNRITKIIRLNELSDQPSREGRSNKLLVNTSDRMQLIDVDTILFLRAESNYTRIYLENGTNIYCARVLKSLQADLMAKGSFLRVHRSFLVRTAVIVAYYHDGYLMVNNSNEQIPVSRRKKPLVDAVFDRHRSSD